LKFENKGAVEKKIKYLLRGAKSRFRANKSCARQRDPFEKRFGMQRRRRDRRVFEKTVNGLYF